MPIVVDVAKANFRLTGPEWEPTGPAWARAREPQRRAYRRRLGELAVEAKRRELRAGKGVDGQKFEPRKWPRPDHANGPPLSPHRAQSRFQRLLAFAVNAAGVTLFWRGGWAKVVGAHAFPRNNAWGKPKRPVRNAVGLTATSEKWVKEQALLWWANRHPARREPPKPPPPAPTRAPTPAPRPKPVPMPRPVPPVPKAAPPAPIPPPAPAPIPPATAGRPDAGAIRRAVRELVRSVGEGLRTAPERLRAAGITAGPGVRNEEYDAATHAEFRKVGAALEALAPRAAEGPGVRGLLGVRRKFTVYKELEGRPGEFRAVGSKAAEGFHGGEAAQREQIARFRQRRSAQGFTPSGGGFAAAFRTTGVKPHEIARHETVHALTKAVKRQAYRGEATGLGPVHGHVASMAAAGAGIEGQVGGHLDEVLAHALAHRDPARALRTAHAFLFSPDPRWAYRREQYLDGNPFLSEEVRHAFKSLPESDPAGPLARTVAAAIGTP